MKEVTRKISRRKVPAIDPKTVDAVTNGDGLALSFTAREVIYHQGDAADAVFYVKSGRVQITVVSDQGKEGSSPSSAPATSLARNAWQLSRFASLPQSPPRHQD